MRQYGQEFTKDTLRAILQGIPVTHANEAIRERIQELLAQDTIEQEWYSYQAVYRAAAAGNALAAGAVNQPVNVNIQADADFLIINQTYDANTANAARNAGNYVIPNVSVLLVNTGGGYQYMDQAVPVPSIFGTAQYPYFLPEPLLLPAKSTLQVFANNYDPAAGYNLQLSFNGVKIKRYN